MQTPEGVQDGTVQLLGQPERGGGEGSSEGAGGTSTQASGSDSGQAGSFAGSEWRPTGPGEVSSGGQEESLGRAGGGSDGRAEGPAPLVERWSFSSLINYEQCPFRVRLKAMGAPVLSKPENRGTKVHQQIELFIRGDIEHPTKEMSGFADDFRRERDLYDQGILKAEERWGFDDALVPCEWVDRWLGMIPDQYWIDGLEAVITDFKTGKKYGNEVRYTQQGQLYMIGAFLRFPEIERVIVRFRYLDERKQYTKMYRREQMKAYLVPFLNRVDVMVNDRMMLPKASRMNCRFCDWGPNEGGTNACPWGVPWIR